MIIYLFIFKIKLVEIKMDPLKEKIIFSNLTNINDNILRDLDSYIFKNPGLSYQECSEGFKAKFNFNVDALEFLINQINKHPNSFYEVIGPFKIKDNRIFKKINLEDKYERSQLFSLVSENSDLKKIIEEKDKEIDKLTFMVKAMTSNANYY